MIRWRIERWRPSQVKPLEVWDLPFRGGLLYERLSARAVDDAQARGDSEQKIDAQLTEALAHLVEFVAPTDPIWIAGGLALRPGLRIQLEKYRLESLRFAEQPLFPGELGARVELARRGFEGGLLVDLGQTALKLSALAIDVTRRVVPRPLDVLPISLTERASPPPHVAAEQAARLAEWLSASMASKLIDDRSTLPALVLALPCSLSDAGIPGPCTYAGWAHDASWVPRMLARLDLLLAPTHGWSGHEVPVLLINDAELAAMSAACEPAADLASRQLAVTLGFGPGAAWFTPERRRG